MKDTTHASVDYSNVTFTDFGKLSIAQKVGFLVFLPVALPIFVLVKVFSFIGVNSNEDHTEISSSVGPETGAAVAAVLGVLFEEEAKNDAEKRHRGDSQWHLDYNAYGASVADMNANVDD